MDEQPRYTTDSFPSAPPMPEPYLDEPSGTHPHRPASNAATTARYEPQPRLYEYDNRLNEHCAFHCRSLLRIVLSFFYAIYLKIQPFLPWTLIQIFGSFCKSTSVFARDAPSGLVRSLVWTGRPTDPANEIDEYCTYFDDRYGARHPAFYRGRLTQVSCRATLFFFFTCKLSGATRCAT